MAKDDEHEALHWICQHRYDSAEGFFGWTLLFWPMAHDIIRLKSLKLGRVDFVICGCLWIFGIGFNFEKYFRTGRVES